MAELQDVLGARGSAMRAPPALRARPPCARAQRAACSRRPSPNSPIPHRRPMCPKRAATAVDHASCSPQPCRPSDLSATQLPPAPSCCAGARGAAQIVDVSRGVFACLLAASSSSGPRSIPEVAVSSPLPMETYSNILECIASSRRSSSFSFSVHPSAQGGTLPEKGLRVIVDREVRTSNVFGSEDHPVKDQYSVASCGQPENLPPTRTFRPNCGLPPFPRVAWGFPTNMGCHGLLLTSP